MYFSDNNDPVETIFEALCETRNFRVERAHRFPHDDRNAGAVALIDRLSASLTDDLENTPAGAKLQTAIERWSHLIVPPNEQEQIEQEFSHFWRGLGFYAFPESPAALADDLADMINSVSNQVEAQRESRLAQRESRLRSKAKRLGYRLSKSRRRVSIDNFGHYMLVDSDNNYVVAGVRHELTLADIEAWLNDAEVKQRAA